VGLKHEQSEKNAERIDLSAEPLVGLKRNDGMVSSKALVFQPNPSWV